MIVVVWIVCLCEVVCIQEGITVIRRGGITFSGLGLQIQPDGYSVGTGAGNDIFEGGFMFTASEASKKLDRTDLADQGVIGYLLRSD